MSVSHLVFLWIKALFASFVYLLKTFIRLKRIEFTVIVMQCQFLVVSLAVGIVTLQFQMIIKKSLNNNVLISVYLNIIYFCQEQ